MREPKKQMLGTMEPPPPLMQLSVKFVSVYDLGHTLGVARGRNEILPLVS